MKLRILNLNWTKTTSKYLFLELPISKSQVFFFFSLILWWLKLLFDNNDLGFSRVTVVEGMGCGKTDKDVPVLGTQENGEDFSFKVLHILEIIDSPCSKFFIFTFVGCFWCQVSITLCLLILKTRTAMPKFWLRYSLISCLFTFLFCVCGSFLVFKRLFYYSVVRCVLNAHSNFHNLQFHVTYLYCRCC